LSKLVEADDHEISMARGELEAVADKALKLSSMLQDKSDEDQLEAWVQSKITKAKDYINSVVDYMTYNPDFATEHMIEAFSDQQIAKLKKEYEPLRGARISVTNANKLGAMFTKFDSNKNALEKLYGGNIPFISSMAMSRLISKHGYTADKIKRIKVAEEVEVLEEGTGTIKGFRNDKEKSNMISLAKQSGLKVKEVSGGVELSGNMRRILDMQLAAQGNGLKAEEYINEGRMSEIDAMRKAGATAADIAKELKLSVKVVKSILGEEIKPEDDEAEKQPSVKDEPKKETKEDDKEKLKAELEKKDNEIAMLKTKAETEKAKVVKKETEKLVNPETGEPLLQVGIAYKHIRDKMQKEEVSEMAKDKAYAIGMATAKKKFNDEPPLEKKTIKKGHEIADKLMGMKKEGTIKEYKKMTVTFNSMADMAKASTDLAKQGFTINAKGMVMKVDGKGADLNKYGTDLQNFYKAKVVAEETIKEYTSQQIKMAYGVANDKRYKGGNYSGAVKAIEKIAKGLSNHPDVMKVLQRTNENVNESPMMSMNKQSPEYKQGQQAAKQGKKYIDNPHSDAQKKLNWSGGHNNYRANNMAKEMYESLAALKKKADKSGMPYSILKKVFDRGMAAWKGGHRPGASQHQWAYARVNSFVTKSSGTWGGADKDLAAKVKGSK
jgi:hypothetical protein